MLAIFSPHYTLLAQTAELPAYESVGSDPDGDGFGWEWNDTEYSSCLVTEGSGTRPSIINTATGAEVNLVRAYWNANRDIADRNIECEYYRESASGEYALNDTFSFTHQRLPTKAPFVGLADYDSGWNFHFAFDAGFQIVKAWTVNNGAYIGPMPSGYWLEIVERYSVADSAVRFWSDSREYYECFDKDGGQLHPSGFIGEEFPATQTTESPVVTISSDPASQTTPIINLEAGTEVTFNSVTWDIQQDLKGRNIFRWNYQWDGQTYRGDTPIDVFNFYDNSDVTSGNSGFFTHFAAPGSFLHNNVWSIENGQFSMSSFHTQNFEKLISEKVELLDSSFHDRRIVRTWFDSSSYYECSDGGAVAGVERVNGNDARDFTPGSVDTGTTQVVAEDTTNLSSQETETTDPTTATPVPDTDIATDTNTGVSSTIISTGVNPDVSANTTDTSSGGGGGGTFSPVGFCSLLLLLFAKFRRYLRSI